VVCGNRDTTLTVKNMLEFALTTEEFTAEEKEKV
jgi:hypothetical protein